MDKKINELDLNKDNILNISFLLDQIKILHYKILNSNSTGTKIIFPKIIVDKINLYKVDLKGIKDICEDPNNNIQKNSGDSDNIIKHSKYKGERNIQLFLEKNNILYSSQKSFHDCIGRKKKLRFDFYVYSIPEFIPAFVIEYQGIGHYQPIEYFDGSLGFWMRSEHDYIKRKYCEINNIPYLEIAYWDIDKIPDILNKWLCYLKNNLNNTINHHEFYRLYFINQNGDLNKKKNLLNKKKSKKKIK